MKFNSIFFSHPILLPSRGKELFAPSPLKGEGWGEGDFIRIFVCTWQHTCKILVGFFYLLFFISIFSRPIPLPSREKELFAPSPLKGEGWGEGDFIRIFACTWQHTCKILVGFFYLLFFISIFSSNAWAVDISSLVAKRISEDGKTLDLTGLNIDPQGAKQLAAMESLSSLTTLHLQGNRIKAQGMKALAKSPHLVNLKHLDLWGNLLGDIGLKAIAESPYLIHLESLKLWKNEISDDSMEFLVSSKNFSNLKALMLNDNIITPFGAAIIAKSKNFLQLETLNLFRNEVSDDGALAFSKSTHFPKLETLYLGDNNITDKGAVVLIGSKAFPALKTLDLGKNLLGEASAMAAFKVNRKEKVRVIYR